MPTLSETPLRERWEMLPLRAKLPLRWELYLGRSNQSEGNGRRQVTRTPVCSIAILQREGQLLGVYTRDVSRMGVGFFSPIHLFPREKVAVELPGGNVIRVSIARCHRLTDNCFACGAVYEAAPECGGAT